MIFILLLSLNFCLFQSQMLKFQKSTSYISETTFEIDYLKNEHF
jgi:hypothetical protein